MPRKDDTGYQGRVVWLPLGDRGLEPNPNPARIPSSALIAAESVVFSQDSIRKLGGTTKLSAYSGSITTVGMADWWPSSGSQKWVRVGTDGNAYLQSSPAVATAAAQNGSSSALGVSALTTAFLVAAGDEATSLTDAIQYRKLFIFTGRAPLRYYDGESPVTTTIASPAEDWSGGNQPVGGCLHNGRLWAWGPSNRPHGLYASRMKNHAYFASETVTAVSTQFFTVTPGAGQRVYAGKSHKGLLFLFKYPIGVAWLDDSDINPGGWRLSQLTDSVGCAPSPYAAILLDDGILFMTPNAEVYLLTATTQGGVELVNLGAQLNLTQWLKDNVNTTKLQTMTSCWSPAKKQAIFSVAQRGGTSNTNNALTLYFDFNNLEQANGVPRFSYSTRDAARALCTRKSSTTFIEVPVFADYSTSGAEWEMDNVYRSVDGSATRPTGYAAAFQTAHSNLVEFTGDAYDASMNKLWDFLDIEYVPAESAGPLQVTTYSDGTQIDQFTVTLTPVGDALDDIDVPLDTFALATISPNAVSMLRRRLTGEGRRLSVKAEHVITTGSFTFVDGDVSAANDTITETAHGLATGAGPIVLTTTGVLPAGLALATEYFLVKDGANTVKLALTKADALAVTPVVVNITAAAGGGTHTLTYTTGSNYGDDFNITGLYISFRDGGQDVGRNTQTG